MFATFLELSYPCYLSNIKNKKVRTNDARVVNAKWNIPNNRREARRHKRLVSSLVYIFMTKETTKVTAKLSLL